MLRHTWTLAVLVMLAGACPAVEQAVTAPTAEELAAAEALAKQKAMESIRAQAETEKETMEAISRLGTPGWERAKAALIRIGRPAVPYLIEAMAGQSAGAFPAQGYPLGGPGRATRTVSMKDTAYAVLVAMFQNHSNYNGALPGKDAAAWREFWMQSCAGVEFGKL